MRDALLYWLAQRAANAQGQVPIDASLSSSRGYLESSTSLLLALLLLASATVMGIADVRLLPKGASRHDLAIVALTLTFSIAGVSALLFSLFLLALTQAP